MYGYNNIAGFIAGISLVLPVAPVMADGLTIEPGAASIPDTTIELIDTETIPLELPQLVPEYRAVAEFEHQQGVIVSWPNWTRRNYGTYRKVLSEIVKEAHTEAVVYIDAFSIDMKDEIIDALEKAGVNVNDANEQVLDQDTTITIDSANEGKDIIIGKFGAGGSLWVRDYGPFFVESDGEVVDLDFSYFQGSERPHDEQFPYSFYTHSNAPALAGYEGISLVWDGGDFLHNGDGLILVPDSVFVENVNTHSSIDIWRTTLQKFSELSVRVRKGLGEHIDWGMKFLNSNTVLVGKPYPGDQIGALQGQFDQFEENIEILDRINNRGKALNIVRIPLKLDSFNTPCAYTNSLILNRKVLVPTCGIPADAAALDIYREQMPGYEIVGIDFSEVNLAFSQGAVHCLTREIPATRSPQAPRALWPAGKIPQDKRIVFQWSRIEDFDDYRIVIEKTGKGGGLYATIYTHIPKGEEPQFTMEWPDQSGDIFTWKVGIIGNKKGWSDDITFKMSTIISKP